MSVIISHDEVALEYFCMRIAAPEIAAHAMPGQFVMLKVQTESYDPLLRIPLAVHQIHSDGISVLYHVVGTSTKILSKKNVAIPTIAIPPIVDDIIIIISIGKPLSPSEDGSILIQFAKIS